MITVLSGCGGRIPDNKPKKTASVKSTWVDCTGRRYPKFLSCSGVQAAVGLNNLHKAEAVPKNIQSMAKMAEATKMAAFSQISVTH
ncbi:hypothetical protein [Oceanobacter mangrovi]|uniref:hypothetical protein n=1 Tax=Oceanobacter mangrovi TaxID=2862510 RepID=UPI001C8D4675|nr:hypothetical protein [Oceanobacter mangrovi]